VDAGFLRAALLIFKCRSEQSSAASAWTINWTLPEFAMGRTSLGMKFSPTMKSRSLFLHSLFAAAVATVTISSAFAANVTWDPTPGTPTGDGTITGGTGNWRNLGNEYSWSINGGVTNIEWNSANNDTAIFGGAAGTVSITQSGGVTAGGLTFNSDGYLVNTTNGRKLILSGSATVTVTNSGHKATISLPIDGTSGLTKSGAGTLVLSSGASTYSGATNVNAGTLAIIGNHTSVTGALTVANAATLTGSGTVGGAATIQNGGIHAAGYGGVGKQTLAGE
jgi:autotransporter-associated beta strand protein